MAKSINEVTLLGRLGKDVEVRFFASGDAIGNTTLATSEEWKDKQTGEKKEATTWHNLVFPGKQAEIVSKYASKGSRLYVKGKLSNRKWTDNSGAERYITEIRVSDFVLLDSKQEARAAGKPEEPQFEDSDIPF